MNDKQSVQESFILMVSCKGLCGIVAAIGNFLADRGCYITSMSQFDDVESDRYFSRVTFTTSAHHPASLDELKDAFKATAASFEMDWDIYDAAERPKVLLMVSKFDHCLQDLFYRQKTGELKIDITAVVSNHEDLREFVESNDVPFHYLPVNPENKAAQENKLLEIVDSTKSELVVLARYMQILSNDLCRKLSGRAINIHHSFLPGFKGAKPYHQAFDRGVKLIGATAHYVTADLDEGPIIEQVVERVDHAFMPDDLVAAGRDSERLALAKAVRFHIERRVFMNGHRTVVFK
ncbi:formyltetrahydrofolate deformylase [Leeia sp. TBRC 13508]|uniref:Formyltetrahydrofolate deformylase n=1 Tax=Leeia speluncae TaxID=2884804 RepID=A0ABS8D2E9_9NEIS|nr:formyltetrahydrofolate deformylase [Leeia speluncae]MCB6182360.1 formyltetrahydrofolate deformylase [Leeia speluncae]